MYKLIIYIKIIMERNFLTKINRNAYNNSQSYKISFHPDQTTVFYSGMVEGPLGTYLIRENISTGVLDYIKVYGKAWNLNSHQISTDGFYCIVTGNPTYILEIDNNNGDFVNAITPSSGYKWDRNYWSIALSQDESIAFFSSLNNSNSGAIWKWKVGTTDPIECIDLGNLHIPMFISRIHLDKVFIEAYDKSQAGDLYFTYFDMTGESIEWSK